MRIFKTSAVLSLAVFTLACPEAPGPNDAGVDRFKDYGEPIDAPTDEWTQVPFAEALCGNGESMSLLINPSDASTKVLLYLEGGGACWDRFTCDQAIASFVRTGIPQGSYDSFKTQQGTVGVFNRNNPSNPFRDFSFVYVPYCTGDVHGGVVDDNNYGVSHVGYNNLGHFLDRVVPTFPDASEVVFAGISAGGFGVTLNYDRVRDAFIDLPVHALIDSAPPLGAPTWSAELGAFQDNAWGLAATNPDFCVDGETNLCPDFRDRFLRQAEAHDDARFALITTTGDEVLRFFFGLGRFPPNALTVAEYTAGVSDLIGVVATVPNVEMYIVSNSTKHTFLYDEPLGTQAVSGTTLVEWLQSFVDDNRWNSVF